MGVVNVLSTALQNQQSNTPPILNQPAFTGAEDWTAVTTVTAASTDSAGSTYRLIQLPSNAIILDIGLMNAANTSGSSYEIGLYAPFGGAVEANGAAVLVPAGTSMATARSVWTSVFFPAIGSGSASAANLGLTLWQLLGLTADPIAIYEVVITAVTAGSAGGVMATKINWTR